MAEPKQPIAKAKYRVLHPISWIGERQEIGTILEMTAAQAAGIGDEYLVKVEKKKKESKPESGAEDAGNKPEDKAPEEGAEISI